jgi:hypothetical protein
MPKGFPVVVGWYFTPAIKGASFPMLPGGMIAANGVFGMIVAGWVAFTGNAPI